jgi:uncharacterized OB-fold protein
MTMDETLPQHRASLYEHRFIAVQRPDGTIYVPFDRFCQHFGLEPSSQARRVKRHMVLSRGFITLPVQTSRGPQKLQCLKS